MDHQIIVWDALTCTPLRHGGKAHMFCDAFEFSDEVEVSDEVEEGTYSEDDVEVEDSSEEEAEVEVKSTTLRLSASVSFFSASPASISMTFFLLLSVKLDER